jgi:hypothetical protein
MCRLLVVNVFPMWRDKFVVERYSKKSEDGDVSMFDKVVK